MRAIGVSTLLATVLLAGCGGGGGGGTPSGEAAKPAAKVLADATKAAQAASSVHVSGQVVAGGNEVGVDLSLARGKGATGSVTLGGATVNLVVAGRKGYIRGGADFWSQFTQAAPLAQLLAGNWLEIPAGAAEFGAVTSLASAQTFFGQLTSGHGPLTNQGETTYKGQKVVAIDDTTRHATLYVAATGPAYPVAFVRTGSQSGTVTFDRWNQHVTLKAPAGALNLSQLPSSG
ncbi:MAG TPA: hypothetical protein VFA37_09330 [Gaiellaceae bacterium]|nr:hypothetical protein [Gaiellaceae bacterium]